MLEAAEMIDSPIRVNDESRKGFGAGSKLDAVSADINLTKDAKNTKKPPPFAVQGGVRYSVR